MCVRVLFTTEGAAKKTTTEQIEMWGKTTAGTKTRRVLSEKGAGDEYIPRIIPDMLENPQMYEKYWPRDEYCWGGVSEGQTNEPCIE